MYILPNTNNQHMNNLFYRLATVRLNLYYVICPNALYLLNLL